MLNSVINKRLYKNSRNRKDWILNFIKNDKCNGELHFIYKFRYQYLACKKCEKTVQVPYFHIWRNGFDEDLGKWKFRSFTSEPFRCNGIKQKRRHIEVEDYNIFKMQKRWAKEIAHEEKEKSWQA
jgi:hypothetical protein